MNVEPSLHNRSDVLFYAPFPVRAGAVPTATEYVSSCSPFDDVATGRGGGVGGASDVLSDRGSTAGADGNKSSFDNVVRRDHAFEMTFVGVHHSTADDDNGGSGGIAGAVGGGGSGGLGFGLGGSEFSFGLSSQARREAALASSMFANGAGGAPMSNGIVLFSSTYTPLQLQRQQQQLQAQQRKQQQEQQQLQQQQDGANGRRMRATSNTASSTNSSASTTAAATAAAAATASHMRNAAAPTIHVDVNTPALPDAFNPVPASTALVLRHTGGNRNAPMIVPLRFSVVAAPRVARMPGMGGMGGMGMGMGLGGMGSLSMGLDPHNAAVSAAAAASRHAMMHGSAAALMGTPQTFVPIQPMMPPSPLMTPGVAAAPPAEMPDAVADAVRVAASLGKKGLRKLATQVSVPIIAKDVEFLLADSENRGKGKGKGKGMKARKKKMTDSDGVFSDDGRQSYPGADDDEDEDEEDEDEDDYVEGAAAALRQHAQSSAYLRVSFFLFLSSITFLSIFLHQTCHILTHHAK